LHLASRRGCFRALPFVHLVQHPSGVAVGKRDGLKPFSNLTCEQVFAQIFRATVSFLFRTAIVPIAAARFSSRPLCREHAATIFATKKIGEWKIVCATHLTLMFSARKYFLDGFKLVRRKNWRKASGKIFVVVFCESEISAIGEYSFHGSFAKWRSGFGRNAEVLEKLRQRNERVAPFGVLCVRFHNDARLHRIRLDIARFRVVGVAKGSFSQPLATTQFLAHTPASIFGEIVAIIFRLAERHLQHKEPLRGGFKPKCRKSQRHYF